MNLVTVGLGLGVAYLLMKQISEKKQSEVNVWVDDISTHVLKNVEEQKDLIQCRLVCKQWKKLCHSYGIKLNEKTIFQAKNYINDFEKNLNRDYEGHLSESNEHQLEQLRYNRIQKNTNLMHLKTIFIDEIVSTVSRMISSSTYSDLCIYPQKQYKYRKVVDSDFSKECIQVLDTVCKYFNPGHEQDSYTKIIRDLVDQGYIESAIYLTSVPFNGSIPPDGDKLTEEGAALLQLARVLGSIHQPSRGIQIIILSKRIGPQNKILLISEILKAWLKTDITDKEIKAFQRSMKHWMDWNGKELNAGVEMGLNSEDMSLENKEKLKDIFSNIK